MIHNQPLFPKMAARFLPWTRSGSDYAVLRAIREEGRRIRGFPQERLRDHTNQVRALIAQESADAPKARIESFALISEALRQACGVELYDVQLLASLALAKGSIAEMQTGQGKTFACVPAAFLHALTGRGVHVATTNHYLAERDCEIVTPAYRLIGITIGFLPERNASPAEKQSAYRCDITYGTGYEFGFDYLRDQLELQKVSHLPLGHQTLEALSGNGSGTAATVQRELYFSIVDEADHVLIDDAASPLVLSGSSEGEAPDAEVHVAAREIIAHLRMGEHYHPASSGGSCKLTELGVEFIHQESAEVPIALLQRTWTEYVQQALQAVTIERDRHYVVSQEGEVQIVDGGTGRIFTDRTWSDGLHQAVEAKENLKITPENGSLAQITRQRFSRMYERLAGMTGTAAGCEREFRQVYDLSVTPIPLRTPSLRQSWPTRFFVSESSKWKAIAENVRQMHAEDRPILIGTTSIAHSERLADLLSASGLSFQLLNGRQDADEAAVIAKAGHCGAVTIATSLAGRGTDIKLGPHVRAIGGLHVIVSEWSGSSRVDRQLIGRCARQGDPGSSQVFVSAEDSLITHHGSWLVPAMIRASDPNGEVSVDFTSQLKRIQRSCERKGYSTRSMMLRRDLSRDSLFSNRELNV